MLIEMGMALAENNHVEAAFILEVPEQTTLQDVIEEPAEVRSLRRRVDAMAQDKSTPISFDPIVSHDVSKSIYEISQCVHCRWMLVEWRGRNRGALTVHNPVGWLKSHLQCNLAVFKDAGVRYIRNIMVLLKNDYNDKIVLETADHLANVNKADVTLMQYLPKNSSAELKEKIFENLKGLSHQLSAFTKVKLLMGANEIESVVSETVEYDLFILGSQDHNWKESAFGSKDDRMISKASCSVMAVHVDAINRNK
jgi:hypothetical protein